jgi:SAM-dependent methyltransferase
MLRELYQERADPEHLISYYEAEATAAVLAGYDCRLAKLKALTDGGRTLLDVGCGAGYLVERAALGGWEASGVEIGDWALAAAARRGVKNLFVGELKDLGFADEHFDVVYCAQVLEHLKQPMELLKEVKRILRPGGVFYADLPNYRTLSILAGRDDWYMNYPPQHLNYFTPATLRRCLVRAGFSVEELVTEGGLKLELLVGGGGRTPVTQSSGPVVGEREEKTRPAADPVGGRAMIKRLMMPAVKLVFYEGLKVGVNIVVFARKPNLD